MPGWHGSVIACRPMKQEVKVQVPVRELQSLKFDQKGDHSGFHVLCGRQGRAGPAWPGPPQAALPTGMHAPGYASPCWERSPRLRSLGKAHLGLGSTAGTQQLFALPPAHHLTGF